MVLKRTNVLKTVLKKNTKISKFFMIPNNTKKMRNFGTTLNIYLFKKELGYHLLQNY